MLTTTSAPAPFSSMNLVNPVLLLPLILGLQSTFVAQQTNVDTLTQREMRERRIPGVQVAVVKDGKIVLSKSFGTADIQHSIPVTNKTIFPIYSCTKAFAGVAIMQLKS